MQLDPRTLFTVLSVFGLVFSGLLTAVTWRKRASPGYTQWICAAALSPLAAFLVTLRPNVPDWLSAVVANALVIAAAILYFDGARAFRGLNPHRLPVYAGSSVTIIALVFFLYVVPNVNVRVVLVSTLMGIIFLWASITLLNAVPPRHRLGLRLTGTLFGLYAATHFVRAYFALGAPLDELFATSAGNVAMTLLFTLELTLFPIGFILLVSEQALSDLKEATDRTRNLQESVRENEERQVFLLKLSDALRPLIDEKEIQSTAASLFGDYLNVNRVCFADIEGDEYVIRECWVKSAAPIEGRGPVTNFGEGLLDAYRRGETVVVNDVRTESRFNERERNTLLSHKTAAMIRVTLQKGGQWVSVFAAASVTPRFWTEAEVELVKEVAERTWDAVDRARTEKALVEREHSLRLALDGSGAAVWRWNVRTNELFRTERNSMHLGPTQETLLQFDAWASGVVEEDRLRLLRRREEILKGQGDEWNHVFRYVSPDGALTWIHGLGRAERDSNGQVTWIAGIGLDITEQRRAEEALRSSEHKFRTSLQAAHLGTWRYDLDTGAFAVDEMSRLLHGFEPDEVIETLEQGGKYIHPDDIAGIQLRHQHALTERGTYDHEYRVVLPSGETRWIASFGQVEPGTSSFFGIVQDVTARKRIERDLQDRHREQEHTLRLMLETATQGILWVDAAGSIVMANAATEAMFGWASAELIGKSVEQLLKPSVRERHAFHNAAYFSAPQPRTMGTGMELLGERKDGSTFPIEISLNHVTTADGGHVIAFVTDISVRKQAEEALRRSHAELERRTLQLSRLASQLTLAEQHARQQLARTLHDGLQQLLFTAKMTLDRVVKGDTDADETDLLQRARADVDEAMEAARTLSVNLFPPILHIGGLPVALGWLAKRTQEQYGIIVKLTADPRANPEASDMRILLFEAVRELLFNAVKHAHVDRVDISLQLRPDNTVQIDVCDEGIGFDTVVTLQQNNLHEAGLGLFSIKERVALLGGRLDIQSAPGEGARFSLIVPQSDQSLRTTDFDEPYISEPARSGVMAQSPGGVSSFRVLIADDHVVARAGLRELLSECQVLLVVGEAADGIEAISKAKALQPDVIVMDVSMPRMNGIQATREIHAAQPHIRIVGLTTHDDEEIERSMREAGADAYFTKGEGAERLLDYLLSLRGQVKAAAQHHV